MMLIFQYLNIFIMLNDLIIYVINNLSYLVFNLKLLKLLLIYLTLDTLFINIFCFYLY